MRCVPPSPEITIAIAWTAICDGKSASARSCPRCKHGRNFWSCGIFGRLGVPATPAGCPNKFCKYFKEKL